MTESDRKEVEAYIDAAISKTVKEFKMSGMLKDRQNVIYNDVSEMLYAYYKNNQDAENIEEALKTVRNDFYFDVIPLFYRNNQTIEHISEKFNVDVSTIVRNKKRLCLEIYILLH